MLSGWSREARSRQQSYVGQVVESAEGDDDVTNGTLFARRSEGRVS